MWFFFLAIPAVFAITLNNCSQVHNKNNGATGAQSIQVQTFAGDGQSISREGTSQVLVIRVLQTTGSTVAAVPNLSITFTSSIQGSFLYNPLVTDTAGSVRNFFTSGTQLGAGTITATTSTGVSTKFSINVVNYSPTSVVASTSSTLEYVLPSVYNSPLDFDEESPNSSNPAPVSLSLPTVTTTSAQPTQAVAALQTQTTAFQNIANPTDSISIGLTSTYIAPITSGSCYYFGTIPGLLNLPCDAENGTTFLRDLLLYTGTIVYQIVSNGASNLDYTFSNQLHSQVNGVKKISLINQNDNDNASNFTPFLATVYFTQKIGGFTKLFRHVDNTMFQVSNINPTGDDEISNLVTIGNKIYFSGYSSSGVKLYQYNGTNNIQQISNINTTGDDQISNLITDGVYLYFSANNGTNTKLYQFNPTTFTISQVSNINPTGNDLISNTYTANNVVYFVYTSPAGNAKLYSFNYSSGKIIQISNTLNGGNDNPTAVSQYNGIIYFVSNIATGVQKLFSYDGTTVKQVSNIQGTAYDDQISDLFSGPDGLYFAAQTTNQGVGTKMFRFDGTNLIQLFNLNPNGTDGISNIVFYANKVYFRATNDGSTYHIFRYDGTVTAQVIQIMGAGVHDNPQNLAPAYTGLYFTGYNLTDSYIRIYRYCDADSSCAF